MEKMDEKKMEELRARMKVLRAKRNASRRPLSRDIVTWLDSKQTFRLNDDADLEGFWGINLDKATGVGIRIIADIRDYGRVIEMFTLSLDLNDPTSTREFVLSPEFAGWRHDDVFDEDAEELSEQEKIERGRDHARWAQAPEQPFLEMTEYPGPWNRIREPVIVWMVTNGAWW